MAAKLGLTENDFFDTTPRYFFAAVKSINENDYFHYKNSWEIARMIGFFSIQPHIKKKLKVTDLLRFDWEKSEKITQEDVERIKTRFKKLIENGTK